MIGPIAFIALVFIGVLAISFGVFVVSYALFKIMCGEPKGHISFGIASVTLIGSLLLGAR